ncbi:MAG: class I SAM-dependent methyltransferase [Pseudomonadota bacterium]
MNEMIDPKTLEVERAYVVDAPYTWSYFEYQNPLLMQFVAHLNGYAAPDTSKPFSYCDLGCGNGVSVNLLAAAYPQGHFVGVDFNKEHIDNANVYVDRAGLNNVEFIDASFDQYRRADPTQFDFITMHGIYSWVGEEVRQQIRDLVEKTLKPGGLLYVCYNTLPGWTDLIPIWKMMQMYIADIEGDSVTKAKKGLAKIDALRQSGARYFKDNPSASRFVDRLLARDPHFVAHEFCIGCFEPQYFLDVANGLKDIGLNYAGTAKVYRNDQRNILSDRYAEELADAPDRLSAEARASFIRNEFFRRDIYVKGGERLSDDARAEALGRYVTGANVVASKLEDRIDLERREIKANRGAYKVLLPLMASGKYRVEELYSHPDLRHLPPAEVLSAAIDLIGGGQITPIAQKIDAAPVSGTDRFRVASEMNRVFLDERLMDEGKAYVQSPVLGSALRLNMVSGLFLRALHNRTPGQALEQVAEEVASFSKAERERLKIRNDKNYRKWLFDQFVRFEERVLPLLIKYGVVEKG